VRFMTSDDGAAPETAIYPAYHRQTGDHSGSLLPDTSRQRAWIPYASSLLDAISNGSALVFDLFREPDARNSGALSQ
jgi:hypothetical protein